MGKGYKKEYIIKVKTKFNDLQPSSKGNTNNTSKSANDKGGNVSKSCSMAQQ